MKETMKVVFFGAGAVGASVGGWLASAHENTFFLDQGEVAEALRNNGISYYEQGKQNRIKTVPVNVIDDLSQAEDADVIALCVKNYSLDKVCGMIRDQLGDEPIIVAFQNGRENQDIVPKYFSKVIFSVVCYNAWLDAPGVVGYQKKGPLVFGVLDDGLKFELNAVTRVFNKGVETIATPHLQDAVHSKMIINLTNSLTTLVGHKFREISDPALFQKLLSNLTYEGVQIVKAMGGAECSLGGMPSWRLIEMSSKLPRFITKPIFEKNVKKMVVSSMAQDIIQRGGKDSELESLNGYFVQKAEEFGVHIPYNKTIYEMCRREFAREKFEPLDVKEVWAEVEKQL